MEPICILSGHNRSELKTMKTFIAIASFAFIILACKKNESGQDNSNGKLSHSVESDMNDSMVLGKKVHELDSVIDQIDSICESRARSNVTHSDEETPRKLGLDIKDTIKIWVCLNTSKARRVAYSTFDEGVEESSDLGFYYFDQKGMLFASKLNSGQEQMVSLFLEGNNLAVYSKRSGKISIQKRIGAHSKLDSYEIALAVKEVQDLMQLYPEVMFSTPKIDSGTKVILKIRKAMPLFAQSTLSSRGIKALKPNDNVTYLGSAKEPVKFDGQSWVLYNVITSTGDFGWVFGHPEFLIVPNDENYE
jgi:hypothetical protein